MPFNSWRRIVSFLVWTGSGHLLLGSSTYEVNFQVHVGINSYSCTAVSDVIDLKAG